MEKKDYKKQLKHLYAPSAKNVEIVDVPEMNFLMVDGKGDPNKAKSFTDAIEALYPLSYTLKFMVKKGRRVSITAYCRSKLSGGLMTCRHSPQAGKMTGNGP